MLGSLLDQDEIEEFMAEADAVTQFFLLLSIQARFCRKIISQFEPNDPGEFMTDNQS